MARGCSIEGCPGVHYGHGMCEKHYRRWRATGDPLGLGRSGRPVVESWQPGHPLCDDAWFAGFVAGEGCFTVDPSRSGFNPALALSQRADNGEIVREIHAAFGGTIEEHHINRAPSQAAMRNVRPQVRWTASNRLVLMRVVVYFDRFPLRSKKAEEYVIWREAVLLYVEEGGRAPGLEEARMELQRLKEYPPLAAAA